MKVLNGSREMRIGRWAARVEQWHPWFAWYPVWTPDGLRWLQWLERRGVWHDAIVEQWWEWQYREDGS